MSQEGKDLSQDESAISDQALANYLQRDIWRHEWERGLAKLAIGLSLAFYTFLIGFIFLGHFRLSVGTDYFFFATKPHAVTDVPVILALSSIPTILIIALLRYFHQRDKSPESDDSLTPLSVQTAKDILDLTKER